MASNELTIYESKRTVRPRQLFVAEPVSSRHVSAALQLLEGNAVPSEITAEDAARAFAVVPRPLPFCLPRRAPRSRPRLSLGFSGSPGTSVSTSTSPATDIASCSSAASKQLRDYCSPDLKETSLRPPRHARYGTITSNITSVSGFLAAAEGEVIDMVSGACSPLSPQIASSLRLPHCTSEWRTACTPLQSSVALVHWSTACRKAWQRQA